MRLIAFDYETHPITADHPSPKPICLSWAEGDESGILVGDDMEKFMTEKLANPEITLIAHNLKFEMLVTERWMPALKEDIWKAYEDKRLVCTMVDEKIIRNMKEHKPKLTIDNEVEINRYPKLKTKVKKAIKKEKSQKQIDDIVRNHVLAILRNSTALDSLSRIYLDIDITAGKKDPDAWRLRYNELEGVDLSNWPKEAIDYSIQDSIYALKIHKLQDKHEKPLSYKSTRADFVLGLAANRGMTVDSGRVSVLKQELLDILMPEYEYLESLGLGHMLLTGKFKKNLKEFKAYIEENVEEPERTLKGEVKLSKESMSNFIVKEDADPEFKKVLNTFIKMADYEKIMSAFVPSLEAAVDHSGLIRTNYNPVVSTGRTSSSGSKLYPSANIQQMPRGISGVTYDVRNCYKAREGFKLVSIDYGGLELAATAHQLNQVYGHSTMKDYLNEGSTPTDLHSRFAAQVMSMETGRNITYDHFLKHKKEKEFAYYRQICKALNLGFPGGIGYEVMGGQLFKYGIHINKKVLKNEEGKPIMAHTEKQAAYFIKMGRKQNENLRSKRISKNVWIFILDELVGLKQRYFEMYPEIETFLKQTHNYFLTGDHKMVKNDFGEWEKEPLYRFNIAGNRRDFAMYTQFCNGFLMQSPSAQGAKQMLWEVGHHFRNNPDVELDAFIHDEIVIEVRDNNYFTKHIDKVAEIMLSSMQKVLPSVRLNVEAAAMTYWSKDGDGSFERLYWMDPGTKELKT